MVKRCRDGMPKGRQDRDVIKVKVIIQTPSSNSPINSSECCFVGFLVSALHVKSTVSYFTLGDSYIEMYFKHIVCCNSRYVHFIAYTSCLKMLKSSICHST